MALKRSITTISLLLAGIGGIIGSAWLFGPYYAAKIAGPAAIFSWVIGALMMSVIALTFAELASAFPVAGGVVRFTHFSHGSLVSFTIAWISWLSATTVAPIETLAIIQYTGNYFPILIRVSHDSHSLSGMGILFSAMVMFILVLLNTAGSHHVTKTNAKIILVKLAVPILLIILLFARQFHITTFYQFGGFAPYGFKAILIALPTAGIVAAFIGYDVAIQMAGEAANPKKAIPIAVIGSISICAVFYILIQIVFIGALFPKDLSHGWRYLSFAADAGPIVGLAAAVGLTWFVEIIYLNALIAPFGTAFIYTASTGRINYAMSKNGYMPPIFQRLNKKGAPIYSIVLNFIIGMIFFLPFPGWQSMITFLVSCFILAYAFGPIALVALRYKAPHTQRSFRLPFVRVFGFIAFYFCNLILYWTGWYTIWHMLLVIALGYIYLFIYWLFKRQTFADFNCHHALWLLPYFIGFGVLSYLGSFKGGIGLLPFGWDFAVIFIFTLIIFYWAVKASDLETLIEEPII